MTDASLAPEQWTPLPRNGSREQTPVRRLSDDDVLDLAADDIAARAAGGPTVGDGSAGRAEVRFWHHAPDARAVALVASGWWFSTPVDACDLRPLAGG